MSIYQPQLLCLLRLAVARENIFPDLWDEDIMLQRKYPGWNNLYRGQSEFLIIALLRKMGHFFRDTKNVLISQQSGAKNRIITKTCNVMAMAKPINSLQFVFLNHLSLSSHEKIFIKVTASQISAYQISYCPLSSWAALCIDCDSDWMAATNCCWRLGKLTHFVPSALHPASQAGMAAWSWSLTPWWHLLTSNDVTPSVPGVCVSAVVTDWRWPGPGGHCLGVDSRLATPDVLRVRSNTCDGKCSQRGKNLVNCVEK